MSHTKPFWPARWWWMALLVILAAAAGLRYTGYDFSLPYVDHVDEPAYNIAGRMIIDYGSAKPIGMHGYPPGIVMLNYVLLRYFHNPPEPPSVVIGPLRLISITFGIGVVLLIALLGYRVATPLAGLFASGMWTITPLVLEHSRFATADNFVTFFTLLAFFLMLSGTLYNRNRLTTYAIVSAMGAVVFKYQAVFVVPLILAGPLWRLLFHWRDRNQVRVILTNLANNVFFLGLFFVWLLVIYPATEATSSPDWSAPAEEFAFPTWNIVKNNFQSALDPVVVDRVWIAAVFGLGLLVWPRLRRHVDLFGLGMLLAGAIAWGVGVSFYSEQFFRQFISLAALAVTLCGVGLALGVVALEWGLQQLGQPRLARFAAPISAVSVAILLLVALWPNITTSIDETRQHTLPDRRNDLAHYMDTSLPSGYYISDAANHKVFNDAWGGYAGQTEFPFYEKAQVTSRPLDTWKAQGITYAIVPYYHYEEMQRTPDGQGYLDQMLQLKMYPPSDDFRGPSMVVFRLEPIQHQAAGQVGPIALVGYDIDQTLVAPGETVTFTLYWQASRPTDVDYVVYNHLVPPDSRDFVAQIDGSPYVDTRRGTHDWDDPDEVMVSQPFTLTIPGDVSPGEYHLITGFYRRDDWQRLIGPTGDDYMLVTPIRVMEQ
ncbi:MAG: phospholipid carrier-dependent glycosyltransferase [Anaerolineae bacterium]|nr:phospholipid carrier-dependent glycosyltransferase [Anaerolineae bacterium]